MNHVRRIVAVASVVVLSAAVPGGAVVDPRLREQWGLAQIGAPGAWPVSTGEGVTIAVVDTGVALDHEDLRDRIVSHVNCVGANGDAARCSGSGQDAHGHGTHVAGIAAATTNNGVGVASVAPEANVMAIRVLEPTADGGASGSIDDVVAGIRWAVDHGADVINLSLGPELNLLSSVLGNSLQRPVNEAWEAGALPVVASGNDSVFPSGYRNLKGIVVTATNGDDEQAGYASNVGSAKWGLAAPGGEGPDDAGKILSTWWAPDSTGTYAWAEGTSMATPHVAGAAALLLSLGLTRQEAVDRLLGTAVDLGAAGEDSVYGSGRLDVAAAVNGLGEPRADHPKPAQSSAPTPAPPTPPPTVAGVVTHAPASETPTSATGPPAAPVPSSEPAPERAPALEEPQVAAAHPRSGDGFDPAMPIVGSVLLALAGGGWVMARNARRPPVGSA